MKKSADTYRRILHATVLALALLALPTAARAALAVDALGSTYAASGPPAGSLSLLGVGR